MIKRIISKIIDSIAVNKVKIIGYSIGALLLIGSALIAYTSISKYNYIVNQLEKANNNITYYQDESDKLKGDVIVLQLTADQFKHSRDSALIRLQKLAKEKHINPGKPGTVGGTTDTEIDRIDTVYIDLPAECQFSDSIIPNKETKFFIKYEKNKLIHRAEINNTQDFFVYSKREYLNEYKNGWTRFWNFDWKRTNRLRYSFANSNDLIKTNSYKVYKIDE